MKSQRWFQFILLLFGVVCGSTAVIMIKASSEHPVLVAAGRLLGAAVILTPFFLKDWRLAGKAYGRQQLAWSVLPGVLLAAHFLTWVVGARLTQVSNASLIISLTPVAMPFFLWLVFRERIRRREVYGTLLTLLGLIVLTLSTLSFSPASLRGDLICLVSMLFFAAYLAFGRRNNQRISLWLYMVPLYWVAGLLTLGTGSFVVNPIRAYSLDNVLLILGLALIPTVLGHTILNYSMKFFRGQVVSVTNLLQPVTSTWMGFLFFGEVPAATFYAAAALIIAGVVVIVTDPLGP